MENLLQKVYSFFTIFGLRIIASIVILFLGRWAAKILTKLLRSLLERSKVDETLISFTCHLSYIALLIIVVIAALNKLGIQTASFIAILGAAGLAVGLALQGSLSNFAAGVLIIIFRPFKVNDFIEAAGIGATVEEIEIFTTKLKTPDNKTVFVPNAKITADKIINYSAKDTRRMDLIFGVSYSDDLDKTRKILGEVAENDDRILKDPAPMIAVKELADSSVNFVLRIWTHRDNYWNVNFDTIETVKRNFDVSGITIPFPQRDVHMYNQK